jgi:hypothetical protein
VPLLYAEEVSMLSLRFHNIADYVAGFALLFLPALFGFSEINSARNLFLFCGFGLVGYSLVTRYYYSALKLLPLGYHMTLDCTVGVALMLGPWILKYRDLLTGGQEVLHYIAGLAAVGLVAITRSKTEEEKIRQEPAYPKRLGPAQRL